MHYMSIGPTYLCADLLTYLLTYTDNISPPHYEGPQQTTFRLKSTYSMTAIKGVKDHVCRRDMIPVLSFRLRYK